MDNSFYFSRNMYQNKVAQPTDKNFDFLVKSCVYLYKKCSDERFVLNKKVPTSRYSKREDVIQKENTIKEWRETENNFKFDGRRYFFVRSASRWLDGRKCLLVSCCKLLWQLKIPKSPANSWIDEYP